MEVTDWFNLRQPLYPRSKDAARIDMRPLNICSRTPFTAGTRQLAEAPPEAPKLDANADLSKRESHEAARSPTGGACRATDRVFGQMAGREKKNGKAPPGQAEQAPAPSPEWNEQPQLALSAVALVGRCCLSFPTSGNSGNAPP